MGNPNFLGTFLVLTIPAALYYVVEKKEVVGIFVYSLLFLALLATRTRGVGSEAFLPTLPISS